jgi:hypothetical protein
VKRRKSVIPSIHPECVSILSNPVRIGVREVRTPRETFWTAGIISDDLPRAAQSDFADADTRGEIQAAVMRKIEWLQVFGVEIEHTTETIEI